MTNEASGSIDVKPWPFDTAYTISLLEVGDLSNAGTLTVVAGCQFTMGKAGDTVSNTGSIITNDGTLSIAGGLVQTAGEIELAGGSISSTLPLDIEGGSLSGSGAIDAGVINKGQVIPGSTTGSSGTLQVYGDYLQPIIADAGGPYTVDEGGTVTLNGSVSGTSGGMSITIGGTAAGSQYTQLDVQDNVSVAGTLDVALSGYTPQLGDQFTIIKNEGNNPVGGFFTGLPEGATLTVGTVNLQISYHGGAGE